MNGGDDEENEPLSNVSSISRAFKALSCNARDLYLSPTVPEQDVPSSGLDFYRQWVGQNRPVVFRGAIAAWPAVTKWVDDAYLRKTVGTTEVTVSATPNGYADSVVVTDDGAKFVMPHEERMTMAGFLDILNDADPHAGIHYIQKQNSNLTDELSALQEDTFELSWAREAFGKDPDAVNFWMGDGRAVTSTHKDPYENIYCVVKGFKDVTLYPPTDLPWLTYQQCQQAKYTKTATQEFVIEDLDDRPDVPWIVVDPLKPDYLKYPDFRNASPVAVRVCAGDVLYLPSLWFHHLQQSHGCIAVNFWYDMDYDIKWSYFQFLNDLVKLNANCMKPQIRTE